MKETTDNNPAISDMFFRRAVEGIDTGNVDQLRTLVDEHPRLLTDRADIDASFVGEYFAQPRLIWFVAENPVRNGTLPDNICDVTEVLIEASRRHAVDDLTEQLNYTLALAASGMVARECRVQDDLCRTLVRGGADPDSGIRSALARKELDACRLLLNCGATLTLPLAAGLGLDDEVTRLTKTATPEVIQEALITAAISGESVCARIMADRGADPNQFNPRGLHVHSTPLHQAVASGSLSTVCALITRGADPTIKDTLFHGDAFGWAAHFEHQDIAEFLDESAVMISAIKAVREGRVEDLQEWLATNGDRVNSVLGDNPRTLLHYANDWPGHRPRVAETIAALIAAGANVDARCDGPESGPRETPLHWAASSDDADAANALITAGADLNITGGCIANCPPLMLAVIFQNWNVAELLVDAGAIIALPFVAGMGRMDLVESFFDDEGRFAGPWPTMPHRDTVSDGQEQIDAGLTLGAMGGRQEVVRFLLNRGANINAVTPVKTTALDEARNNNHNELAAFLRDSGARTFEEWNT